ncbi:midasin, partial [Phenoliferia sp. Uapishka_3]
MEDSNMTVVIKDDLAAPLGATIAPDALNFDIAKATFCLLAHAGIFNTSPSIESPANQRSYSSLQWRPLIPTADAITLLAAVPTTLLPLNHLPFAVPPPRPSSQTRRHLLDTIARLALEPPLTLEVMRRFRPLNAHLWGRWLEMLGLDAAGEWRAANEDGSEAEGERQAVGKVFKAMVEVLPVFENVFPFLTTLLRHPMLASPPIPAPTESHTTLAGPLLTFYSLIHALPHLASSTHTSTTTTLPWSFPISVEVIMKTHPHRGTRLLAWRILRKWYGFYAGLGESLREAWVWKGEGEEEGSFAPLPPYMEEYKEEYENQFGKWKGESAEADLIAGWSTECTGDARFVEGGVEVLVRERAIDAWVLPAVVDAQAREERANLWRTGAVPTSRLSTEDAAAFDTLATLGALQAGELSLVVVNVEGHLLFREGFIPSTSYPLLSSSKRAPTSTTPSSKTTGPKAEPFVTTPATTSLLHSLALHTQRRLPVLISSPPSSGKASTITHLWSILHSSALSSLPTPSARQRSLVLINLADRSLDSKSLLGSLSSAPATADTEAGTFAFVEGPLTRAVRQGRWVVLSGIDQASVEVLSVVKVLVERMRRASESAVGAAWGGGGNEESGGVGVRVGGGEGRWVSAGRGFMLFATRSVEGGIGGAGPEATFFTSSFWSEVWMDGPKRDEIELIVEGRYPRLKAAGLAERLIGVWDGVREVVVKDGGAGTNRSIGVRDLMRWCRRVEGLIPRDVAISSIESNPVLQEEVFTEARDVFLGSLPVPPISTAPTDAPRDRYTLVARVLAQGLGLSAERAEWVIRRRVPELVVPRRDEDDGIVSKADLALKIGRVSLPYRPNTRHAASTRPYALTKPSLVVLEKLAVSVRLSEPVLMVGETGTGKTAAVGHLADLLGKNLTALNLSNQTEAGDLVGGFRPIDEAEEARRTASELVNRFVDLFGQTFSISRNAEYVTHVRKAFERKRWGRLVSLWREAYRMASERLGMTDAPAASARKRRKIDSVSEDDLPTLWREFVTTVGDFDIRHVSKAGKSKFVFSFVEGPLAKAIRSGDWVLLDEVNLASSETLESLSTLLQAPDSSLVLTEQGDLEPIPRHPDFRLFACMNPATDVGKRDLPAGLRAKFSEIWVPPPDEDRDALVTIVQGYIGRVAVQDRAVILDVAELYSAVKALAMSAQLADGANAPPHFSMRTLARALTFAAEFAPVFGLRRALYEGFLMAFTMLLDAKSNLLVKALLEQHIVAKAKNRGSMFAQIPAKPSGVESIRFGPYWLDTGEEPLQEAKDYILTASVQSKVLDLARAVLTRKVPVLIQGPTSAGKTSVVEYLARRTGHRFVRINNHEHTDIQEYIGTYVSDTKSGKLIFQEGVLVRALRRGDWIVLDELNLAPTDVLEALNRLLDDNRELVIPETGEVVRPHPHFMLFATQNPPGLYGGRKVLSRAFRNRFLEMHFGDVPKDELETILCQRCQIAPSYAKKTVGVFIELQRRRQAGRVFEQKHAFVTLRDLFRWGGRGSVGYQQLAEDGYMLLAERARKPDDKAVVKDVIEQEMNVKIDETTLYDFSRLGDAGLPAPTPNDGLVWTSAMRRLYYLIAASLHRNEPVLLVGETGSGKTSVCQSLALALGSQLHVVGCHQNTETADLLGGQRPLRSRAALQSALRDEAIARLESLGNTIPFSPMDDIEDVIAALEVLETSAVAESKALLRDVVDRMRRTTALFEWHDGPLVQAMHGGDLILLDEISLADDSVLERLNSVLEPSRTLVLAEKGGRDLEDIQVVGADGFQILATMNPGGDFGKKELSPALRNRFTEIWVPHVDNAEDLIQIINSRWSEPTLEPFGPLILEFGLWFAKTVGITDGLGVGLRDILAWVDFLNVASARLASSASDIGSLHPSLPLTDAFFQGALMTVVDGLGALPTTSGLSKDGLARLRTACSEKLSSLAPESQVLDSAALYVVDSAKLFFVGSFGVGKGALPPAAVDYTLQAPTTRLNAMRLLRALQLTKPVLLEGSPGVGKTSLVTALAAATGHHLVRINLSDQTDLMDLLGSDLPVEGGRSGEFAWKDAPFLAAMQEGSWVLLDEMNLASQSILEGLNSSLDHRGTVYIPELDRTFSRHPDFRIFAAQNPLGQGGGRKGLPRSFLDRFSIVHMEELNSIDLNAIATSLFPDIAPAVVEKMISFNSDIHRQTMDARAFGMEGSPWEFNLRDVLRWLALVRSSSGLDLARGDAVEYVGLLYLQRFRTLQDRKHVAKLFEARFTLSIDPSTRPWPSVGPHFALVGHSLAPRSDAAIGGRHTAAAPILQRSLQPLEALAKCVEMGWLAILTGLRSSGKTTLVRQLAALQGRPLKEFSMNAEVDTLELLGSFEQAERYREIDRISVDAIILLEDCLRAQLLHPETNPVHSAVSSLKQLRVTLGVATHDFDLADATSVVYSAIDHVPEGANAARADALRHRLEEAATAASNSARFEWVDGPLIQAMKAGHWLLIEDANLCSPSVLDRLNSLFEPGGRLQLGERGPVDGEIQIIYPHADFRLVMTLDPRHGELSRAMRNRGIEIALLPTTSITDEDRMRLANSSRTTALPFASASASLLASSAILSSDSAQPDTTQISSDALVVDPISEASITPVLEVLALCSPPTVLEPTALAKVLFESLSQSHHALALRFLRTMALLDSVPIDSGLRSLGQHWLSGRINAAKNEQSIAREVPFELLRVQPIDVALSPQLSAESSDVTLLSPALSTLVALLLSSTSRPEKLRLVASKAAGSLDVWDKSFLAASGKVRLDDADPAVLALAPLSAALADLIRDVLSVDSSQEDAQEQQALVVGASSLQSLLLELEHISHAKEVDFSSTQHVAEWISKAMRDLPAVAKALAANAQQELTPLQSSLRLTTGKAMTSIWRACLPFRSPSEALDAAYQRLLSRGANSVGELWDPAVVGLFLDIAVALGIPQPRGNAVLDAAAVDVVDRILAQIPASTSLSNPDETFVLTVASNAATLVVTELAAVADAFGPTEHEKSISAVLVEVSRRSAAVPLTSSIPLHQLVSWTANSQEVSRSSVEFATLLGLSERLALGLVPTSSAPFATAELVKPVLLRASNLLRITDSSNLGNLLLLAESLQRAAAIQALAATEYQSRISALRCVLVSAIALATEVSSDSNDDTRAAEWSPASLLAPSQPLSPVFSEAVDRHLASAIPAILTADSSLEAVGEGFVAFARCFWYLYVPSLPLDPAVGLRARSNFLSRQLLILTDLYAAHERAEASRTGNGKSYKLAQVGADVEALRSELDNAGDVPVTREGNPALLSSLFRELRSFQEQIVNDGQLDSLLLTIRGDWTPELASREANLQHSVATLLRRLNIAYASLSDILAPVRLALCCLKIGFALLMHTCRVGSAGPDSAPFALLLHHLTSFPTIAHTVNVESTELPLSIKPGEAPLPPSRATLLQISSLTLRLSTRALFDQSTLHRLTQLYDRMHLLWSVDRRHEEEEAQEAASLYRTKTDVQQISSDEEIEAAEFAQLFPTFEDASEPEEKPVPVVTGFVATTHPRLLRPTDQATLASLHLNVFGPNPEVGRPRDFEALRSSSVATLLPTMFDELDEALDRDSAVYRIRTLVELSQALAPSSTVEARDRDFYLDADVKETAKAVPILLALGRRLEHLIEQWPDQMVLRNLLERCQKITGFSSKTSIAQVLTAIEQLLSHTEDWESYASREHSLILDRTAITNLIVEWRRLELTCWSRLLSTVQARFGDPVAEWWFRFYETTIRGAPGVDVDASEEATQTPAEYYRALVTLLNSFLSESSLGQYQARLDLVLSFANLASKLATDTGGMDGADSLASVSRIMLNVHAFYDQFTLRTSTFLTAERKRIEKDVQALIKLASWKDVNVYALRQSAIKSHHQLYKSVRKLRAVLQKPASDFFTVPEADRTLQPTPQAPASSEVATVVPALSADLQVALDAPHIAKLEQTLGRLSSILTSHLDPFLGVDRATSLDEFAVQIITTSKSLKAESVPGEEEGREQRIKSLTQRKRRAWIELLRELKRIGLSPTPTPEVVARLQDPAFVYGIQTSRHLLDLDSSNLSDHLRTLLEKAHEYHFRLLSELPTLRAIPANHHEDISTREVLRAIGSIESCINLGFDNRQQLVEAITSHTRLSAVVSRMKLVGDADDWQPTATSGLLVKTLLALVSGVRHALEETRLELINHRLALGSAASNQAVATVEAAVVEASRLLEGDQDNLSEIARSMGAVDFSLSIPSERAVFENARKHLIAVEQGLSTTPCPPSLRYIVHPLATWVSSLDVPCVDSAGDPLAAPSTELSNLNAKHKTLVDSVLVIAQELQKLSAADIKANPEEDELPDSSVKISTRSLQATLAVFRLPEILAQVEAFTVDAQRLSSSPASGTSVAVLLQRVSPFLHHYSNLVDRHLASFLEWHKASLKVAHVLTAVVKELSASGFCKPSEDDGSGGDAGADGKTTDGTGMADGQGATNVSKDIEDESQVEGLQGEVDKKEEKPEEKEGDDDAVEMSMDFEGEMEDRGDGEKEENEEDGESDTESQPDPEEQIADVDPLDPSSVDEKFWGDEASKDTSKNEEINQETTKSAGESEMGAKEDEAPAPQPKGDDATDAKEKEDSKDQPPPEEGAETSGDAEDENAEAEGENEDEDEGDTVPQTEDGERLDDRMPEADNLDLPDDMQLDGDDNKKEDDLDLGSDMGDMGDLEEGENDNEPDEVEENGESKEETTEEDALPSADAPPEGDQPDLMPEEAPALDQSLGGADEGETGGEGAQDSSSASKPDPLVESDPSADKSGTKPEAKPTPAAEDGSADDGPQDDGDQDMDADADPSPSAPSNSADGQTKQRSSASDPKSDPSRSKPNEPSPEEPQRSLGDALQSWRRRLEAIADLADTEKAPEELLDPEAPGQEDEVEYVPEGDEREQDGQALGPAKEEQVQGLESLRLGEDATETGFEPDAMEVDDNAPLLPQAPDAIQLDGSSLAEADAKAIHADELREDRVQAEQDDEADDEIMRDDDEDLSSTTLAKAVDAEQDEAVEQAMLQWRSGDDPSLTADGVWRLYESLTRDLSYALTEQLRLILEPTLATRLKGDYRSGKRLNMKKIIPYIASEFTKDKIWLRRTRPSQREYQIMIAIDDSKSMADSHSVHLAYQTLALISRALARLEVGGISICRFGDTMDVLHAFESGAVNDEAGATLLGKFTFSQRTTDVRLLVEKSLKHLALAKDRARATKSSLAAGDLWQLQIIISDGMCQDHEKLRALLRQAAEQKVLFVFVVIDSLHRRTTDGPDATPIPASEVNQNSILAMKSVSYSKGADGRLELKMDRYLDSFPFEYFVVLRDVEALPEVLSATLRQFMEKVSSDR